MFIERVVVESNNNDDSIAKVYVAQSNETLFDKMKYCTFIVEDDIVAIIDKINVEESL